MKEQHIPFNYETYQSGNYRVITRDGRDVNKFQEYTFEDNSICFTGGITNIPHSWDEGGNYGEYESHLDLFLIPIDEKKEENTVFLGNEFEGAKYAFQRVFNDHEEAHNFHIFKTDIWTAYIGEFEDSFMVNIFTDDKHSLSIEVATKEEAINAIKNNIL